MRVSRANRAGPRRPSAPHLQGLLTDRDNSFDVLRLAAAVVVLVFHAFDLAGHEQPVVPLTNEPASGVGLFVFFSISGFLVARSWLHEPRVLPFAIKRGLRILPGLLVALAVSAYVIGAVSVTEDRQDYLTSAAPAKYVTGHSLFLSERGLHGRLASHVMDTPADSLPGVFSDNPSTIVNAPIWTLPIEIAAYTLLALGGLLVLFWGRWSIRVVGSAVFIAATVVVLRPGPYVYPLYAVFAGGVLLYALRARLKLTVGMFALAVGAWIASYQLPEVAQAVVTGLTVPYAVVFLAFRGLDRFRWLTRPGDLSYGIYIYAWPIQQLVVHVTGTRSPAVVIAVAGAVTYVVALVSWRVVERPALRLKGRLTRPSVSLEGGRSAGARPGQPAVESA